MAGDGNTAADGNTGVAPMSAPSSAPTQFLFDAVDDLSQMYLTDKWTGSIKFHCLPVKRGMIGLPLDKTCIKYVDICDFLGYSTCDRSVLRLYLDPRNMTNHPSLENPSPKIHIGFNSRTPLRWLLTPMDHPSCATGVETLVYSNASFVTGYTRQSWERRTVLLGKTIASTWTRVVDAGTEGHTQREPVPPRHSQRTVSVHLHLLSNGITLGSTSQWRRSTLDVPIMQTTSRATYQNSPCQCN
jgi:hypothetical protein